MKIMTQRGGFVAGAERTAAPGDRVTTGRRAEWRLWSRTVAVWLLAVIVALACYLRLAGTRAVDSDGASQALQAWDMLHGNVLLHGWTLSDVSFYTTELPEYMLVELARGLSSDVVHFAAALTYTLTMLLAALLAKGRATGGAALARVAITAGIMLAPQLGPGVKMLVSSPDHIGTSVPVLLVWLILDRARPRWYVPAAVGLLLAWAAIADTLVLFIGVLPLALVCVFRFVLAVLRERQSWRKNVYELALGCAALAGAGVAEVALRMLRAAGGFVIEPPVSQFTGVGGLRHSLNVTGQGLLLLPGADFLGLGHGPATIAVWLHLVGVALVGLGVLVATRRFVRSANLVDQVLVTAIAVNLAAYVASTQSGSVNSTREIAVVLPFGAALAGRMLADQALKARLWRSVLLVVLAGYVAGLGYELAQPSVPAQNYRLSSWLQAHHLHYGLSGYWESNVVTLTSGAQVRVRQLTVARHRVVPYKWESDASWYNPRESSANFVVLGPQIAEYAGFSDERAVLATFGRPARRYRVGSYEVLVWNRNLLGDLGG